MSYSSAKTSPLAMVRAVVRAFLVAVGLMTVAEAPAGAAEAYDVSARSGSVAGPGGDPPPTGASTSQSASIATVAPHSLIAAFGESRVIEDGNSAAGLIAGYSRSQFPSDDASHIVYGPREARRWAGIGARAPPPTA